MRQINHSQLINFLLPIAQEAGKQIMMIYDKSATNIQYKQDNSPLTEADHAAHNVLFEKLSTLLPGCPVVSEEDASSQKSGCDFGRFWLIDPLDGTKEFIARSDEFTVNIALIEDGRSILGVVFAPAMNILYWGGPGLGAFRDFSGEVSSIHVSKNRTDQICRVVASKSHLNQATQSFIDRLGLVNFVQAGSSLKFCRIAEGVADIYPRLAPTCEWDTAAAHAILEGAGGEVLDLKGQPLLYGKSDVLNPSFIATRDRMLIPNN